MPKKPGLAVAIAVGRPKHPPSDLGSPSDFGAPPSRPSRGAMTTTVAPPDQDEDDDQTSDTGDGSDASDTGDQNDNITLSLTQEQASALSDVLQQIQDQMGDQGNGEDMGPYGS